MKYRLFVWWLVISPLAALAQSGNPWIDSTQLNRTKIPLCLVNGIVVNLTEVNIDFVKSMNVSKDRKTNQGLGELAVDGCIYIEADQQFDVVTPGMYQLKKPLPNTAQAVVYMLNGHLVTDTLRISKASVKRVDILSGADHLGGKPGSYCLSIWTLTNEERGLPKSKDYIQIRGVESEQGEK